MSLAPVSSGRAKLFSALALGVTVGAVLGEGHLFPASLGWWPVLASLPITGGLSAGLLATAWAHGTGSPDQALLLTVMLSLALHLRRCGHWVWRSALVALVVAGVLGSWSALLAALGLLLLTPLLMPIGGPGRGTLTLVNTVIGQGTFGLACCILPLVLPLLTLIPHGRRLIPRLLRLGALLTLRSTPTMQWHWQVAANLPPGPWVVISNHQSVLDILSCLAVPGRYRQLLAKPWVFRTPGLGWAARIGGMVPVESLDEGRIGAVPAEFDLVIFPEGTRSMHLGRFRSGAVQAALDLGRPLVITLQDGSGSRLAKGGPWIRPGFMSTRLMAAPPLPEDRTEASRCLRKSVAEALAQPPRGPSWTQFLARLEDQAHTGPFTRWRFP